MSDSLLKAMEATLESHSDEMIGDLADSLALKLTRFVRYRAFLNPLADSTAVADQVPEGFDALREAIKRGSVTAEELVAGMEAIDELANHMKYQLTSLLDAKLNHIDIIRRMASVVGVKIDKHLDKASKSLCRLREEAEACDIGDLESVSTRLHSDYQKSMEHVNTSISAKVDSEIMDVVESLLLGGQMLLSDIQESQLRKVRESKFAKMIQVRLEE